jgi:hypothetical protein
MRACDCAKPGYLDGSFPFSLTFLRGPVLCCGTSEVLSVKLFVSALLLAAASAAFTQNQTQNAPRVTVTQTAPASPQAQAQAVVQSLADRLNQAGCPLYLRSASVASEGGYLPVTAKSRQDGALDLHFRNQSGKPIASASITARVSVKTNVYALDAHTLELRLTLSGTQDLDKTLDQIQHIVLPPHVYLFGVARVTLDQVTFADGGVWTAAPRNNACRTGPVDMEQIAK